MAQLVTVHIDYIESLHRKIAELSTQCVSNRLLLDLLTYDEPLFETQP
jgi:hypothetical protein